MDFSSSNFSQINTNENSNYENLYLQIKEEKEPKKEREKSKMKKEHLGLNQQDVILAPYGGFFIRNDDSMSQML